VATAWRLPIGTGAGMVHRLVHVRGVLAVGAQGIGSIRVNRVAALDVAGSVLAFFLPGPEASSMVGPVDWFPDNTLAAFTQAVGLGYQQVRIHSLEELAQQFPGLYDARRLRAAQGARWVNPLIYVAGGSLFVWVANVGSGSAPLPIRGVFSLLGLAMIGVGMFASPPVMARLVRRSRRRREQTDPGTSPPEPIGNVPALAIVTASQPSPPMDKTEGSVLNGSGGRHYRLLWHESGWVRARRLFLTRLPEAKCSPPPTALQLRMAALANLVLCIASDLMLMVMLVVVAAATRANGGHPPSQPGSPVTPGVIAFAITWWGLVVLGVTFLVLAVVRFRQSVRETRPTTTT
jgi:hypothetical protein